MEETQGNSVRNSDTGGASLLGVRQSFPPLPFPSSPPIPRFPALSFPARVLFVTKLHPLIYFSLSASFLSIHTSYLPPAAAAGEHGLRSCGPGLFTLNGVRGLRPRPLHHHLTPGPAAPTASPRNSATNSYVFAFALRRNSLNLCFTFRTCRERRAMAGV